MKNLSFISLIKTFLFSLLKFTLAGGIGWLGIIFILLKIFNIINWSWFIIGIPLEYGVVYCLYMTIDGAKYRAGLKSAGKHALYTSGLSKQEAENLQIQTIVKEGPDHVGEIIDRLCNVKGRLNFNQALLDGSLQRYSLSELAILGNKDAKLNETLKKWQKSGLILPKEGTPKL